MSIPLKYLLPLLTFLTGFILVIFQTYLDMNDKYNTMVRKSTDQAKFVGNRLASRLGIEIREKGFSEQHIVSLIAPYMADTLDQINIYDQNLELKFSRYVASHGKDTKDKINLSTAAGVLIDQFANISYLSSGDDKDIIAYFPIDLPVKEGSVMPRGTGIIHLVFDVSMEYEKTRQGIIRTAISNVAIIASMIVVSSLLMYFLVFKRLNALHRASLRLAHGDFDVHVNSKGDDELTQVIQTVNAMAVEMNAYKHTMQERVDKALEERSEQTRILIQQSKLASMGEMIGNIAHQWRQPLNALSLLIQKIELFSERDKLTPQFLQENIQKATSIIDNMSMTIDDFRDFFKPDKKMEYFDLKEVMHDVMVLLDAGLKDADIKISITIDQPECEIFGFRNEFSQVIINLINNSKDALIESAVKDKRIYITGRRYQTGVTFKISDNAGGIPEGIIDRVFEPYYTTKEEGKGTGIGLYMSKMIVEENMNGTMRVHNNALGAEFTIIFKNIKRPER